MSEGDVWRTPAGEIAVEISRRSIGHHEAVEVVR